MAEILAEARSVKTKGATMTKTYLPIQKRHLKEVMAASLQLAAKEDANAEA